MNKEPHHLKAVEDSESKTGRAARPAWPAWVDDVRTILLSKPGRITLAVVVAVFALRLGVTWWRHSSLRAPRIRITIIQPVRKTIDSSLTLPGDIEAIEQASIFAHVSGYLKKLYVDEGDRVRQGQLLAEIDAPDVVQEFNKAKAEFNLKEKTRERYQKLLDEKVVSQQEFDTVDADADETKARLDNAQANVQYTQIRAPFSGSIARRYKYEGDLISTGAGRGGGSQTPIFLLVNESALRAAVNVPQSDASKIKLNYPVQIRVDALQGKEIQGKISRIDALLDEATKTQRILVDVANRGKELHAGMFATIVIHFDKKENVLTVPQSAISTDAEGSFLFAVRNGTFQRLKVEKGISDADSVEITNGLNEDDWVVATPSPLIQPEQKVSTFKLIKETKG